MAIDTPHSLFRMDIHCQMMVLQTIYGRRLFPVHHGGPVCVAEILLKQTMGIGSHMVVVVTVKALAVRESFSRICDEQGIHCRIFS